MGVLLTLSHCPPHPPARLTHHVSTQCSEQIPGKVARQHIVFVCIKICAIKWTIKCPFVIFIGLQCCKMLKAFIFSFAMTKALTSIVHGQNVDQNFLFIFNFTHAHTMQFCDVMTESSRRKWIECWLIVVRADHRRQTSRPPKLHNYKVQPE